MREKEGGRTLGSTKIKIRDTCLTPVKDRENVEHDGTELPPQKNKIILDDTPDGTRTHNLLFRRQMLYH